MSHIQREPVHAGEFLLSEGAGQISREVINVAAGAALMLDRCSVWSRRQVFLLRTIRRPQTAAKTLPAFCSGPWASPMSPVVRGLSCAWRKSVKPI